MSNRLNVSGLLPQHGPSDFYVIGPPGCGKTTWLRQEVEQAVGRGDSVMVSSFTRAAAAELAGRQLKSHLARVGTLHSFCFWALDKPTIALDRRILEDWNSRNPHYAMTPADSGFTESVYKHVQDVVKPKRGDIVMSRYEWYRATMATARMPPAVRHFGDLWTRWKHEHHLLDFTDLILECLRSVPVAPAHPSVIFIDEAQDLSPLEWALIRLWGGEAGRLVLVGDPDQTIYAWRGAKYGNMSEGAVPDDQRLILTQSYRVPREVHARAVQWINQTPNRERIEYRPRSEKGESANSKASWREPQDVIDAAEQYIQQGKTVMFISSCAYMLGPLLKELRSRGIPFHNAYRDSNTAWNPLAIGRPPSSMADALRCFLQPSQRGFWDVEDLLAWSRPLDQEAVFLPDAQGVIDGLSEEDRRNLRPATLCRLLTSHAIQAICQADTEWYHRHLSHSRRGEASYPLAVVTNWGPEALLETPKVTVGTIHSVKGGQADVVFLSPDVSGAGMKEWQGNATARSHIYRLFYVGMTRARETIVVLSSGGRTAMRF